MAEGAVGILLENLKLLLVDESGLIDYVKEEIEGLHNSLIRFKTFLWDSKEKRSNDQALQALAHEITRVVDKAEDAVDKFIVEQANYKARSSLRRVIHATDHSVRIRLFRKEIEVIMKDISEIYERMQSVFQGLQLEELPDRGAREVKPPIVEEDIVVGFDDEAKTVIEHLTGEDQDLDIITIIGMPGLGKTTLAKKIYNDPTIEYEFFTRVWVYVSQKYKKRAVFLSILGAFKLTLDYENKSDDVIVEDLREYLEKGKYLIVMDDVWTVEAWNDLKVAFPKNNKGSRILITSRNSQVARHANPTKEPHNLKFLTADESWELLERKVFGKGKCPPGELQWFGQQIASECRGLPLAIVVIGGVLLNNRESSHWWRHVAENVSSFIAKDDKQFRDVVALTYDQLPYNLKLCFLYLGVFPEDYEIPVWELICLWIAEGFIEQIGELSLEDIAEAYVEDLVNRNLLLLVQRRSNGQIKTCRVHDMLSDFCKAVAKEQNFCREIKRNDQVTPDKHRRLCLHSSIMEYISRKPYGERVRSFLCFAPDKMDLPNEYISTIPKAFELLKVLDFKSIVFYVFPKELLQLVLLRFLAISCNIRSLPSSISKLWNMQTLIFLTTSSTLELKEGMWKMYQLRHLRTNASALLPHPPSGAPKGREKVQSLSLISPESCTERVFARTPNILKLGVRGNLLVLFDNLFDNIGRLQYLTNLKLINDTDGGSPSEGKIPGLPPAYKFPTKLKKLTLSNTLLDWDQMQILGNLEKLEVLKLKDNAFKGQLWVLKDGGFLGLKFLHIGRTDLVTWKASKHHLPSLKRLVLQHCDKLEAVPIGLADVASFQELELYRTPKAAASAREIQKRKMITGGGFKLSIYPPDI